MKVCRLQKGMGINMENRKGNELTTCFKLLKYTMNAKMSIATISIFFAVGTLFELVTVFVGNRIIFQTWLDYGALFLFTAAMYPAQLIYSMDMSGMVQSSAYKKKIQTLFPAILSFMSNLTVMVFLLLIRGLGALLRPDMASQIWTGMFFNGILLLFMNMMTVLIYKFYVITIAAFAAGCGALAYMWSVQPFIGDIAGWKIIVLTSFVIPFCIAMVFVGILIQYFWPEQFINFLFPSVLSAGLSQGLCRSVPMPILKL